MKKLRIIFYTDSYLPSVDGVVNSMIAARKELERRGHEVFIFTSGKKETEELAKQDDHLIVLNGVRFKRYPQYTFAIQPEFHRRILELKPDILHAQTPFSMGFLAVRAAKLTGAKLVISFHTLVFSDTLIDSFFSRNKVIKFVGKMALMRYLRWLYRKGDVVVTPSLYIKKLLKRKLGLKNPIQVVHSGIEFDKKKDTVSRDKARKKLGIGKNEKVLLYLGRISPEKNIPFLLKAAPFLEKEGFKIIIAGGGPFLGECKALASKYSLKNTTFPGFIAQDFTKYYYSAADVFCNPSLFETESLVDVEAMARNLPILVPARSAQSEFLLKGKCGEKFIAGNKEDLVKKAVKIYKNRHKYSTYKVAKIYFVTSVVRTLEKLYYSLLNR
jgi:1,2-diacylglycerol 3-alpha-glucosyltransferase